MRVASRHGARWSVVRRLSWLGLGCALIGGGCATAGTHQAYEAAKRRTTRERRLRAPQPKTPQDVALAIKLYTSERLDYSRPCDDVAFVRLPDDTSADSPIGNQLYWSTTSHKGYAYAFNIPAGCYAAVACLQYIERTLALSEIPLFLTYLPREGVMATRVCVERGKLVFIGEVLLSYDRTQYDDRSKAIRALKADDVMSHYVRLVAPTVMDPMGRAGLGAAVVTVEHVRGAVQGLSDDETAQQAFRGVSGDALRKAGWLLE